MKTLFVKDPLPLTPPFTFVVTSSARPVLRKSRSDAFPDHGNYGGFDFYEYDTGIYAFEFYWVLKGGENNIYTYGFWTYAAAVTLANTFNGDLDHGEPTGGICYNLNIRPSLIEVNGQPV